ncbi:MAG TPA: hypothetical protein VES65_10585, partial [Solirubrobacteraceae bacterium]|nr:hypothetical protein [Solirubrobacteraceae bacterium]
MVIRDSNVFYPHHATKPTSPANIARYRGSRAESIGIDSMNKELGSLGIRYRGSRAESIGIRA